MWPVISSFSLSCSSQSDSSTTRQSFSNIANLSMFPKLCLLSNTSFAAGNECLKTVLKLDNVWFLSLKFQVQLILLVRNVPR